MARAIRKGGKAVEVYGTFQDITNRKRAEDALRESEANYRQLFDNAPTVIYQIDFRTGKFLKANDALCEYLGYSQQEITLLAPYDIMTKESQKLLLERLNKMAQGDKVPEDPEYEIIDKNGKRRWVQLNSKNIYDSEGLAGADVVAHDITDRKQAEDELKQSEERYRSIFENVQEGIFRATPDGRVIMSNQAMAKMFGYESSEELMAGVTDIAHQYYVNPEDRRKLKEMLEEYGFTKEYETQNYRKDGSIIWTSLAMQAVRDDKGQIMYYDGIAEDITNRKENVERMRKALGATVQAIAMIVETRDPYTAGHQRRVADLARSIATEMKLPVDQIDGIRMAAAIHDLGKISVPADILSKPTKLTALEFSLIKTHSQSGYDILKDIDFPWPVARIVLEHHERMNGSGYPNGLTGDNLLMESRILSVADVVESMGSHRPYRPSLGIEAALEEIEKNRGTLYDNTVADACLRLFREKGYQLEGT
jgi:PAS domain S-box-containing protein